MKYFFTTLKVSGYTGLLIGVPLILYEVISFIIPGLTKQERQFLGPVILGSSLLFYIGIAFSYAVLTPAALNFFVSYADGAVESIWSIDQYFDFILVLMLSTGLSFQVRAGGAVCAGPGGAVCAGPGGAVCAGPGGAGSFVQGLGGQGCAQGCAQGCV